MDKIDEELLKQNPFQFNWSERYIACVGDNGGTTNDDILAGFKSSAILIIDNIKYGQGTEDELIYPLVYSIRHCVELALKISINLIKDICEIKSIEFGIEEKQLHTHDIHELSELVKKLYAVDRRLPVLLDTALDYAKDFFFDKQSDVFRYERDLEGKELLKELHISHISVGILEKKFLRMYELLEYAIYSLSIMKNEYSVKTWTKVLSRYDIEQISKELMPINKWREETFDDNRNEIKKRYGISGKALSDAINIIKANPLFANNIHSSISLGAVSYDELRKYAALIAEFTDSHSLDIKECRAGDGISELLEKLPQETAKRKKLASGVSNEALFSIAAFGDMVETGDYFCENYQKHYDHFKNDKFIGRDRLIKKIGKYVYALKVLRGMEWCGQGNYLSVLKPLINEIAKKNSLSLRYT